MKWLDPTAHPIPPRQEVLIITDLGELFIAWRNKKNSVTLDIKSLINNKVEWVKNGIKLKYKCGKHTYCPVTYWCEVKNLTKSQFAAKFEMHKNWNRMFKG